MPGDALSGRDLCSIGVTVDAVELTRGRWSWAAPQAVLR
jgi:hypothetical protein